MKALNKIEGVRFFFRVFFPSAYHYIPQLYITPLRTANPPIISPLCLDQFIKDVFGNYEQVLSYHSSILSQLFDAQKREHPFLNISSVSAPYLSLSGEFMEAYLEYTPNYIHANWKIEHEMYVNPSFKAFVEVGSLFPCLDDNLWTYEMMR